MATVQVRYIVHDVDAAIAFYCQHLGFHEDMHPAPAFAMLSRGDLRLVLSAPNPVGGGGQSMPDGTRPQPGGWNRFSIEVDDLVTTVEALRKGGSALSQRYRYRHWRQADPRRRPFRQPHRTVRADPA
jgi:catechol 2,3-dioxygenase-like lactoylglutathione lyase family enzyme